MPQLAPMNWLLLMILFWSLFTMIMVFFWWNKDKKYKISLYEMATEKSSVWPW